jgi:DNA-binding beta-propeller fold protein YncE
VPCISHSEGSYLKIANRLTAIVRAASLFLILAAFINVDAQTATGPLKLDRAIPLPGVAAKFDHLAIDLAGNRLFVAATGNHSVEVIDLASNKIQQSIKGLGKPHGLAWVASTGSLYVADGTLAELGVYTGSPLALAGKIKLSDDADDMVYDPASHLLFVGHGGSDAANPANIAVVDTEHFKLLSNLPVATHPEALDIDPATHRVFANIADSAEVAVIDTKSKSITAHWKLTKASANVPMALNSDDHTLLVACRTPGTLVVVDAATGKELTTAPSAGGADDLFYNSPLRQAYLISGRGEIDSFSIDKSNSIHVLPVLKTSAGAKTALFVPQQNLLYLAVPGTFGNASEIRVYSTVKGGA